MWVVLLERRRLGSCCGSVEARVEARDPAEAERLAIEKWKAAAPRFTYALLVTTPA